MEIRRIKCRSGKEYQIVNEPWATSRAWGHRSVLLTANAVELADHKIRYINRTWEMYAFQSCMSCVVRDYETEELNRYIERYKDYNEVTRFKKGEREKAIAEFYETEVGKDIIDMKKAIEMRDFQ